MRGTLPFLVALALAGCGPGEPPPAEDVPAPPVEPQVSPEETAMKDVAARFAEAWNAGDVTGVMATFADEADMIDPGGLVQGDRDAIQARYEELFAGVYAGTRISVDVETIRVVEGVGLMDGSYEISGIKGPEGEELPALQARFFNVMTGQGSDWSMACVRPWVPLAAPPAADGSEG
jgi:uncharacterized protein (TIGR02246 family)